MCLLIFGAFRRIPRSSGLRRASYFPLPSLLKLVCSFSTVVMATKTYTQTITPPTNHHHHRREPWDLSVTFTSKHHPDKFSQRTDFRREHTAPPTFGHFRAKTLPTTRFAPYARDSRPATQNGQPVNVIYGVHTSLDLRPYKSPADEFLPQVKVRCAFIV